MVDLPDMWLQLVRALVKGAVPWRTPADLTAVLDWKIEATTDVLALLDEAGWIQVWEQERGPVVTLSPLGAERLGVRLMEFGPGEHSRWIPVGEPEPSPPVAKNVCSRARAAALDFLFDSHPTPDVAAEEAEARGKYANYPAPHERAGYRFDQAPPFPTVLLGLSMTPWEGPWHESDGECPACGTRRLRPNMYCLYCDRWGLDGIFATVRRPRAHGPRSEASQAECEQLRQTAARATRRQRREVKFATSVDKPQRKRGDGPPGRNGTPLAGSGPLG